MLPIFSSNGLAWESPYSFLASHWYHVCFFLVSSWLHVDVILIAFSVHLAFGGCLGCPWDAPGADWAPDGLQKELGDQKAGSLDPPRAPFWCSRVSAVLFFIFQILNKIGCVKRGMSMLMLSCRRGAFLYDFGVAKATSLGPPLASFWGSRGAPCLFSHFRFFINNA